MQLSKENIIEIGSYDSDVEVVLCIQAPEKKNVKESKSQVVSHPSSMKQPPRKVPSSSDTKDIMKNPPRKVPRSYPLMMKDKKPLLREWGSIGCRKTTILFLLLVLRIGRAPL